MADFKSDSYTLLSEEFNILGLAVNREKIKLLDKYIKLLQKWNKAFNLTSITNTEDIINLHIIDSASVAKFIKGDNILDVGTGGGLPGIILAILMPEKQFTLLDSNSKKVRFLRQCKLELGLNNICPTHERIEKFIPKQKFDIIISRAFSSLDDFFIKCQQHLAVNGLLLAMKGKWPELLNTNLSCEAHDISRNYLVRHVVVIKQTDI